MFEASFLIRDEEIKSSKYHLITIDIIYVLIFQALLFAFLLNENKILLIFMWRLYWFLCEHTLDVGHKSSTLTLAYAELHTCICRAK
jgi:hypothetical protein